MDRLSIGLSREQLAAFLPDHQAIKAFEKLIKAIGIEYPDEFTSISALLENALIDAGLADTKANQALNSLASIAESLSLLALTPKSDPLIIPENVEVLREELAIISRILPNLEFVPISYFTGTVVEGGTGRSTGETAYCLVATGKTASGSQQTLPVGATTDILVGGGAAALPVWTTATGTGAPVRKDAPVLTGMVTFNVGGVYIDDVGSGVGTIGFNSTADGGYLAGVDGYGALIQFDPATGLLSMFAESNVLAGAAHSHITALQWTATGAIILPISLKVGTGIGVGNTAPGAGGIAFPAAAVAVADPNTLDDYEENTWTPAQGAGLTVVGAFSSSATYTKIGRQVTVIGWVLGATSVSVVANGEITSNLPFAIPADGRIPLGNALTDINTFTVAYGLTNSVYADTALTPTSHIYFQLTYFV